jgi:hypothetical protein
MFSFIEITDREENMPGWRGTILRIDLTAEKITKQPLDRLVARNFIGESNLLAGWLPKTSLSPLPSVAVVIADSHNTIFTVTLRFTQIPRPDWSELHKAQKRYMKFPQCEEV